MNKTLLHTQLLDNGLRFDSEAGVLLAPLERLRPDPGQPRKHFDPEELAALTKDIESWRARGRGVAATGFLQPILGRWEPGASGPDGRVRPDAYIEIVDGERRWRSVHDKNRAPTLQWVPVVLDDLPAREARDAALRSSIHRANLLPIEEAHAFAAKMDEEGWGIRPTARFYNVTSGYVENRLALLGMQPDVQQMVGSRPDALSSARVIDKVKDQNMRRKLIESVVEGAPFAEISERADPFIGRGKQPPKKSIARMPRIDVEAYLENATANLKEVHEALQATPMPKEFYRRKVKPQVEEIRALLEKIEGRS